MNAITLDNEQLKEAVNDTIRQIGAGIAKATCGTGLNVTPKFKVAFQAVVVVKGGLNAIKRTQDASSVGEKLTISTDLASVEKVTRTSDSTSKTKEDGTVTSADKQTGTTTEDGSNTETGKSAETGKTSGTSKDTQSSKSDQTGKESQSAKDATKTSQSQGHGTTQTTTTEYSI